MQTAPRPTVPDVPARFHGAPDFPEWLESVEANRELWHGLYRRARVPADVTERAARVRGPYHLLVLSEDWCGDAVNAVPLLARLVETLPGVDLRVLGREENPDLMDSHLTDGRSRSIPVVIAYDGEFREVGWWGPRPAELQAWVLGPGQALSKRDRYREVRRWFARDRGRTTLHEILDLMVPEGSGVGADHT